MTKTGIAFVLLYGTAMLAAFVFPPAGVWGFLFESNYHPPYKWWGGPLQEFGDRWSFYIGAVMIFSVLFHWPRYSHIKTFSHPQTVLLAFFIANAFLVTMAWGYGPAVNKSWNESVDYLKWFAVYICLIKTHSNRRWLPIVLMIYILSCIHFGWDSTMDPKGGRGVRGGPVTAMGENFLSPHAIALMPLVCFYAASPGTKRWFRISCVIGLPMMLNIVAHGSSRGAFLALLATTAAMLVLTRGRLRTLTIVAVAIGALLSLRLFHDQFWNRMSTLSTYEEDDSATGRIEAWNAAWTLAGQNPFGYGAEAFDGGLGESLIVGRFHSTHSMFFEVLVAWGWQGVLLFYGYVLVTMRDCWHIQRRLWQPNVWPQSQASLEALGILIGLIGMIAASMFVNRMRWELWWVFGGYVACMKNVYAYAPVSAEAPQLAWALPPHPTWQHVPQGYTVPRQ